MDFFRTHKQIYFDLQLPYDKEKFNAFKSVLPSDMFTPIVDRKVDDSGPPALKSMPEGAYVFEDLLVRATENLHQADPKRLKIQQLYSEFRFKNAQKRLLQF